MKKLSAVLVALVFAFAVVGVNAQTPQAPAKKEAVKTEKKTCDKKTANAKVVPVKAKPVAAKSEKTAPAAK